MNSKILLTSVVCILIVILASWYYFFAAPQALPEDLEEEAIQIIDCGSDYNCLARERVKCSPALFQGIDNFGSVKIEIKGKKNSGCEVQISYLDSVFEQMSGKSMDCIFPAELQLKNFAEYKLSDLCSGSLVPAMEEVGKQVKESIKEQYKFGAPCSPTVLWENENSKYEILGVEKEGERKLFHTDYTGPPEEKEVCHARLYYFNDLIGDFNLDHWFDINDEGLKAYFNNQLPEGDINSWCSDENINDYFETGEFHADSMQFVVIDGVKECFKKFYFYPYETPGVEVNLLLRETGISSVLVRTERGTSVSRDFE